MDPTVVLNSIQGAISITKAMFSCLKTLKQTDQKLAILDLKDYITKIREQLVNAKDLIINLMQENQELKNQIQIEKELEHDENGNVLWLKKNRLRTGPYCSNCYGAQGKLISLNSRYDGSWGCPSCKNHYYTKEWQAEQMRKHREACQGR